MRDRDVYTLFKQLLESGGYSCAEQVYGTIASLPAPRHYLDARTAARRLAMIRDGKVLEESTRARYYSLYAEWMRMPERDSAPLIVACERLLEQPAPSFYLSPRTVRKIVTEQRKKERDALYGKARR